MKNFDEFQTFTSRFNTDAYDCIDDILHSTTFPPTSYSYIRDSGYETTSSNVDQQRLISPSSPSKISLSIDDPLLSVVYYSSPVPAHSNLSSSLMNTTSRTLKTFSHMPMINISGNESSKMMIAQLAEQEIIEV